MCTVYMKSNWKSFCRYILCDVLQLSEKKMNKQWVNHSILKRNHRNHFWWKKTIYDKNVFYKETRTESAEEKVHKNSKLARGTIKFNSRNNAMAFKRKNRDKLRSIKPIGIGCKHFVIKNHLFFDNFQFTQFQVQPAIWTLHSAQCTVYQIGLRLCYRFLWQFPIESSP